jgi:hypothetical protein
VLDFDGSAQGLAANALDGIDLPDDGLLGPIAGLAATAQGNAATGEGVNLAAALASGKNVSYIWDFGDGSQALVTTGISNGGSVIQHIYAERGDYVVTVTATNHQGTYQATTIVHIGYEAYFPLVLP